MKLRHVISLLVAAALAGCASATATGPDLSQAHAHVRASLTAGSTNGHCSDLSHALIQMSGVIAANCQNDTATADVTTTDKAQAVVAYLRSQPYVTSVTGP